MAVSLGSSRNCMSPPQAAMRFCRARIIFHVQLRPSSADGTFDRRDSSRLHPAKCEGPSPLPGAPQEAAARSPLSHRYPKHHPKSGSLKRRRPLQSGGTRRSTATYRLDCIFRKGTILTALLVLAVFVVCLSWARAR